MSSKTERCCCPPKGYSGPWAGAMCPIHQGFRRLVAPVVERQPLPKVGRFFPNGYSLVRQGDHSVSVEWSGISMSFSENEPDGRMGQLVDFLWALIDDAPPELAELQATIDTEGKFREAAEGGWREANRVIAMQREKLDAQEAEIERLKGRQREPVLWFKRLVGAECRSDGRTYDVMFCEMPGYSPLFSSQPAPVSVEHSCGLDKKSKCSACLDKVKELNL